MRNTTLSAAAVAVLLLPVLGTAPALALNTKSYVSSSGNDANSCATAAAACATFQGAYNKTTSGGEISVVNTGEYGMMHINMSIHVTNDGAGEASIRASSSDPAIYIDPPQPGEVVSLRGLVLDGQASASEGIHISRFALIAVHVQNCVIRNFEYGSYANGIAMLGKGQLFVSDTIIFNNGSVATSTGILIQPYDAGTNANVVLDRVRLENNVRGLWVDGSLATGSGAHVVIRESVVSGNAGDGILATTSAGKAPAFIAVQNTASVNNAGTGIRADGPGATMLLNNTFVTRNAVGIATANSGQLISYGNNKVNNNLGPDGVPTGSYGPL